MNKEKVLKIMGLIEAKEKRFSIEEIPANTAYVFKNIEEFNSYFINNGVEKDMIGLATSALITILNDGRVFAYKNICDFIKNGIIEVLCDALKTCKGCRGVYSFQ